MDEQFSHKDNVDIIYPLLLLPFSKKNKRKFLEEDVQKI